MSRANHAEVRRRAMTTAASPARAIRRRSRRPAPASTVRNSATIAAWTMASRATGLLRVVAIGAVLGPTFLANNFVATNSVPTITYSAVAGPVLALVVVPAIVRSSLHARPEETAAYVRRLSGLLLTVSCAGALVLVLISPLLAWTLVAGVPAENRSAAHWIAVVLLLLVAVQVPMYATAGLGAAAQQARERYALAAAAPTVENIGLLVTMGLFAAFESGRPDVGSVSMGPVLLLGVGATVSVALHAAVQVYGAHRVGLSIRPDWSWRADPGVRTTASRMRRSVVVAAVPAGSLYVLLAAAATVPGGTLVIQMAYLVHMVPVAIGARAVATTVLPRLSAQAADTDRGRYAAGWRRALLYAVITGLPALCVLTVMAEPIAELLAAGELRDPTLVTWLAGCITVLGIAQLARGVQEAAQQALFARLDLRGPRRASWLALVVTLGCVATALVLPAGLPRLLALATAVLLADLAAAATLLVMVRRSLSPARSFDPAALAGASVAALTMVPVLWVGNRWTTGGQVHDLLVLTLSVLLATVLFAGVLFALWHRSAGRTLDDAERASVNPVRGEDGMGGVEVSAKNPPDVAGGRRTPAWSAFARRALDVTVAATVLVVAAIPLLLIALWIRLDSPGPALFRQERVGLGGRQFICYKFRSMRVGVDDRLHRQLIEAELRGEDTVHDGSTKVYDDPRVTRSGRFLRRTSLDELPQLVNVLRGDMALVGPRPCLPWEAALFPVEFAERFLVRPGLTGLWQVCGRTTLGTLDMLRLDVEYVRNQQLRGDLLILLRTFAVLVRGDGAR
jgi:lipopolysaccharide/colanic/teichoic acid biosynthesis glycosyltransferase/peptidoglycan biosynthesis protein MviN/MurJ (putative lipid II flippase)